MSEIAKILASIRPNDDFSQSVEFVRDGLLDSLDLIRLVSELENHFDISIDGLEIVPHNFRNLGAIQELVDAHLKDRGK